MNPKTNTQLPLEDWEVKKEAFRRAVENRWLQGETVKKEAGPKRRNPIFPIFSEIDSDLNLLSWRIRKDGYARTSFNFNQGGRRFIFGMSAHHIVCLRAFGRRPDFRKKEHADHINRIRLDNRRENLRIIGLVASAQNKGPAKTHCSRKVYPKIGANFIHKTGRWRAQFQVNKKTYYCGMFDTKEEAWAIVEKQKEQIVKPYFNP